jgi:broad specificity phosphatase PhoE
MILYFLRHGESESNAKDIFAAKKIDLPLTHLGIQQAEAQAKILKNVGFEKTYTSPLLRAKQTAEIVGKSYGVVPIITDCLCEIDIGILDGKSMRDPHYWGIWEKTLQKWEISEPDTGFPEGETLNDIKIRFTKFIEGLRDTHKPILMVSHCGFFMAVIWLFCKNHGPKIEDGHMGRGCFSVIKRKNNGFELEKFNAAPRIETCNLNI